MKRKLLCAAAAFLIFIASGTSLQAAALDEGAYLVSNTTYYVNPDTGAADDGGDTSTGEGMCRNATFADSLYAPEGGKHYVTLRIKLISFISNIHFYVQQTKGDTASYQEASYTVTGQNAGENTKDFRFEMPSSDVLIKPRFFVGPMNRDVTYFVRLDMATAKADEGTFAAFNGKAPENSAPESAASETAAPEISGNPAPTQSQSPLPSSTPLSENAQGKETSTPAPPAETGASEPTEPGNEPAGTNERPDLSPGSTSEPLPGENGTDAEDPAANKNGSEEVLGIAGFTASGDEMPVAAKNEDAGNTPGSVAWPTAAVLFAAGIAAILVVRRRIK